MSSWKRNRSINSGQYIVQKVLGRGGFGIVYLAIDRNGRQVAIKTLNSDVQQSSNFDLLQEKFYKEAKFLEQCDHPNIVKQYELIKEDGLWCIVMEYVDGESLETIIKNKGSLSEIEALKYINQVCNTLTYIHKKNILHRDVKPSNIILRRNEGRVVLIDFGLAREFIFNRADEHTVMASPRFAPPEQYRERVRRGDYIDVYALAATLYALLTANKNKKLYYYLPRARDREDYVNDGKQDPLQPPQRINPNISERVNNAILNGMILDYKLRPQSVENWSKSLTLASDLSCNTGDETIPVSPGRSDPFPSPRGESSIKDYLIEQYDYIESKVNRSMLVTIGTSIVSIAAIYIFSPYIRFPRLKIPFFSAPKITVNYDKLHSFLESGKLEQADNETLRIMLKLTRRTRSGQFKIKNIENIPCEDLKIIDLLWSNHTNGKFSFTAQKDVWISKDGEIGIYNPGVAVSFMEEVGWRVNNKQFKNISYNTSSPKGHLPYAVTTRITDELRGPSYLAKRLDACLEKEETFIRERE